MWLSMNKNYLNKLKLYYTKDNWKKLLLKSKIFSSMYNRNYFKNVDIENKEEMEYIKNESDLLLEHKFHFCDRWDMESCSTIYELNPFDWNACPNNDSEWTYELNRHDYLKKLIIAYWNTDNIKYIEALKYYIFNWIEKNPKESYGNTNMTRTIETGMRLVSWTPLILHLISMGYLNEKEFLCIADSMKEQIVFLKNSYLDKYRQSNWGIFQTVAIIQNCAWFREFFGKNITEIEKWAKEELLEQLNDQFLDDGFHWEQSIMYNVCLMNYILNMMVLQKKANENIDENINRILKKMYDCILYSIAPDYTIIAQSDSDIVDIRDSITKGAIFFNDSKLKALGYKVPDIETIWVFGTSIIPIYKSIKKIYPSEFNGIYYDSGNFYFRNNWTENANYTYLHNGLYGSAHKHSDLLNICNYYKGKPFLIDPGRYTYLYNGFRKYFKESSCHNVTSIDNFPISIYKDSWTYSYYAYSISNKVKTIGGINYIEMSYLVQNLDNNIAYCCRKCFMFPEGIWIIVDDIRAKGKNNSHTYFNLDSNVKIERISENELNLINDDVILKLGNDNKLSYKNSFQSRRYNEKEENIMLYTNDSCENEILLCTWMLPSNCTIKDTPIEIINKKDKVQLKENCKAKEIYVNEKLMYVIFIYNQQFYKGTFSLSYKDTLFYGRSIVLKKNTDVNKFEKLVFTV